MPEESFRDRLAMLSRREVIGLGVVLAVTIAGAAMWYVRSLPEPVRISATSRSTAPGSPDQPQAGPPPATPSPAALFVHVAGWVRRPGVFELHEGERVIDAIEAAGGARPAASLDGLNLAAPLADGTQILVPKQATEGSATTVPGVPDSSGTDPAKVNVNTADVTQLETLPGIGVVLAQTIVDHREENGPFSSVDELEDVSGIGPATLEEIRDLVTL
jgi:competence protein ComEA